MKKYEIMYIIKASLDEAQFEKVQNRLHATITENGGSIDEVNVQVIMEKLGGGGHFDGAAVQFTDKTVDEACAGDKLLDVGRYGCSCGQYHAVAYRGRSKTEAR